MEIIIANHSGFCFGVKQAIDKAMAEVDEHNNVKGNIYSLGPIIHNKMVTDELEDKGLSIIDDIGAADKGDSVIIRSHGVGKNVYDEAEKNGVKIIDTTCPYVKKIHNLVTEAHNQRKAILILGDKSHPEVMGINGWCNNEAVILLNKKELTDEITEKLAGKEVFMVVQTTMKEETFNELVEALKKLAINVEIHNTICSATKKRQDGCKEVAQKVDLMLVIGDENSSNSRKLFEISKKYCKNSLFIHNTKNFSLKPTLKYNRIGVAAGASTPENAIKEVITTMSEVFTKGESMADFMEEIEKSLRLPRSGELVTGTVHQVTDEYVIVNLGVKKDGIVPKSEVVLEEGQELKDLFKAGEEIDVKVLKTDDGDGTILLSRKKLAIGENWTELVAANENKETVEVTVTRKVNGGVIAVYKEVNGFIPLSQLSDKYVEDASEFIGQTLEVRVSRIDPRKSKAVFSRKALVLEEKQKILDEIWSNINVGDIVEGTVKRFTDYGAFVDIGGIDGLLHISEISWGKLKHPKEVLQLEERIQVKILSMNSEKGKISLGLKQTKPAPWTVIDENYEVGGIVKGKVVQIKEYGCFIEIEPGLDGLVHISEVSNHRVEDINNELSLGDEVSAKILEIDKERKRISLSIKATLAPETEEAEKEEAVEEPQTEAATESVEEPQTETEPEAEKEADVEAAAEVAEEPVATEEA